MENNKPAAELAEILQERGRDYGSYEKVAATAQRLKAVMRKGKGCEWMPDAHRESVDMICSKLARLAHGDFNKIDTWQDIAGYATLVVKAIRDRGDNE